MLGLLVCLLILFWLLRKVIDWLSTGGNNMRRVEGGWIVDPGGRDKPYFLRDETDDDEDDETEYDDCEEEEDDPSILERFYLLFHPEEIDTQEYQRAIKLSAQREPTLLCTVSKVIFIQNRKKAFQYR